MKDDNDRYGTGLIIEGWDMDTIGSLQSSKDDGITRAGLLAGNPISKAENKKNAAKQEK
jgi:hypothetical protein